MTDQPGRLLVEPRSALRERCEIASVRQTTGQSGYDDGAVVPCDDWRTTNRLEAEAVGRHVELVRLDAPSVSGDLVEAAARLKPFGGRYPTQYLGCALSPADAMTTTVDPATGSRLGLHIDNWDRLPYPTRHRGRRRLCINLGPGIRYLLLGDQDIQHICRALHRDQDRRFPHTDDLQQYVADGHSLRCLRLRLRAGDGYIVPTELLPHDGSTHGLACTSTAAF